MLIGIPVGLLIVVAGGWLSVRWVNNAGSPDGHNRPIAIPARHKKLVRVSCAVMAIAGAIFLVIGLTKGLGAADAVGVAALLVAGAEAWLSRRTPTRSERRGETSR